MKFLGITDEERLALEQAGVPVDTIKKLAAEQTEIARLETEKALREIQEVVGPHGSVTRLQAGGVKIERGLGVGVFEDGILKTMIDTQGNFFVGSNIEDPSEVSLCVFVNDQIYNNEEMGEGDLLIGDNSDGASNVKWDQSEGQLQIRLGQTVNVYSDSDGTLKAGEGNVILNADGIIIKNINEVSDAFIKFRDTDDSLLGQILTNTAGNLEIVAFGYAVNNEERKLVLRSQLDSGLSNVATIEIIANESDTGIDWITLSADYISMIPTTVFRVNGPAVFNENGNDVDFRVESDNNAAALKVDAGFDRVEFGADHFIPNRNASNPNVYFNEANQDMDFIINGATVDEVFKVDAGLDKAYYKGVELGGGSTDGWNAAADTWTRTGNHTFTVPTDLTATYRKGTKVRYKDGGAFEYGVIISSSYSAPNTTVTLLTNTDYTMAAATITDKSLSYSDNPEGFPTEFNRAITWTNLSVGNGTLTAKVKISANCNVAEHIELVFGNTTSISGNVSLDTAVAMSGYGNGADRSMLGIANAFDDSAGLSYPSLVMALSTTSAGLRRQTTAAASVQQGTFGATQPFTWTNPDVLTIRMDYFM